MSPRRCWSGLAALLLLGLAVAAPAAEKPPSSPPSGTPSPELPVEERLWIHRNLGKAFYENPTTQYQAVDEFRKALDAGAGLGARAAQLRPGAAQGRQEPEGIAELEKAQAAGPVRSAHLVQPRHRLQERLALRRGDRPARADGRRWCRTSRSPRYNLGALYKLTGRPERSLRRVRDRGAPRAEPRRAALPALQRLPAGRPRRGRRARARHLPGDQEAPGGSGGARGPRVELVRGDLGRGRPGGRRPRRRRRRSRRSSRTPWRAASIRRPRVSPPRRGRRRPARPAGLVGEGRAAPGGGDRDGRLRAASKGSRASPPWRRGLRQRRPRRPGGRDRRRRRALPQPEGALRQASTRRCPPAAGPRSSGSTSTTTTTSTSCSSASRRRCCATRATAGFTDETSASRSLKGRRSPPRPSTSWPTLRGWIWRSPMRTGRPCSTATGSAAPTRRSRCRPSARGPKRSPHHGLRPRPRRLDRPGDRPRPAARTARA